MRKKAWKAYARSVEEDCEATATRLAEAVNQAEDAEIRIEAVERRLERAERRRQYANEIAQRANAKLARVREALTKLIEAVDSHRTRLSDSNLTWGTGDAELYQAANEALAIIDEEDECVCGEPDTPGVHRTDGPCYEGER